MAQQLFINATVGKATIQSPTEIQSSIQTNSNSNLQPTSFCQPNNVSIQQLFTHIQTINSRMQNIKLTMQHQLLPVLIQTNQQLLLFHSNPLLLQVNQIQYKTTCQQRAIIESQIVQFKSEYDQLETILKYTQEIYHKNANGLLQQQTTASDSATAQVPQATNNVGVDAATDAPPAPLNENVTENKNMPPDNDDKAPPDESEDFLMHIYSRYDSLSEIICISSAIKALNGADLVRRVSAMKHLSTTQQDHDVAAQLRIVKDQRHIVKSINKKLDINAISDEPYYRGKNVTNRDALLRHHFSTIFHITKSFTDKFLTGNISLSNANKFKTVMKDNFDFSSSETRMHVVRCLIELLAIWYVDLLGSKKYHGIHYPSRKQKRNILLRSKLWKIDVERPNSGSSDLYDWNALDTSISWMFALIRNWMLKYTDEYLTNVVQDNKFKWIEEKICKIGEFWYNRRWKWKCDGCGVVAEGEFDEGKCKFFCDFCWYEMVGYFPSCKRMTPHSVYLMKR